MISAMFEMTLNDESGFEGLKMMGHGWMDPFGGMGIAHDLLEHFPNDSGRPEEELLALGAMLYVRYEDQYFHMKGAVTGWAEAVGMFLFWDFPMYAPDHVFAEPPSVRNTDYDDDFYWRAISSALESHKEGRNALPLHLQTEEQQKRIVGWLKAGYAKAVKRYEKVTRAYEMVMLFSAVEKMADEFARNATLGERCRITVSPSQRKVWLTPEAPWHDKYVYP